MPIEQKLHIKLTVFQGPAAGGDRSETENQLEYDENCVECVRQRGDATLKTI